MRLLGLLVGTVALALSAQCEEKNLGNIDFLIVADFTEGDHSGSGDPIMDNDARKKQLEAIAKNMGWEREGRRIQVQVLRARDSSEFKKMLETQIVPFLEKGSKIQGLIVRSHGRSDKAEGLVTKNLMPEYAANLKYRPVIENQSYGKVKDGGVSVTLNDLGSMRETFGPIMPKKLPQKGDLKGNQALQKELSTSPISIDSEDSYFAPGALISFEGCNLLDFGNDQDKEAVMARVAKYFGLSDGIIYMNRTIGTSAYDTAFKQDPLSQPTVGQSIRNLAMWATFPISAPTAKLLDTQFANKGHVLLVFNLPGKKPTRFMIFDTKEGDLKSDTRGTLGEKTGGVIPIGRSEERKTHGRGAGEKTGTGASISDSNPAQSGTR